MSVLGVRRLVFGLYAVTCATLVQAFVEGGWTPWGFATFGAVNLLFYGERAITALAELLSNIRGLLKDKVL